MTKQSELQEVKNTQSKMISSSIISGIYAKWDPKINLDNDTNIEFLLKIDNKVCEKISWRFNLMNIAMNSKHGQPDIDFMLKSGMIPVIFKMLPDDLDLLKIMSENTTFKSMKFECTSSTISLFGRKVSFGKHLEMEYLQL